MRALKVILLVLTFWVSTNIIAQHLDSLYISAGGTYYTKAYKDLETIQFNAFYGTFAMDLTVTLEASVDSNIWQPLPDEDGLAVYFPVNGYERHYGDYTWPWFAQVNSFFNYYHIKIENASPSGNGWCYIAYTKDWRR